MESSEDIRDESSNILKDIQIICKTIAEYQIISFRNHVKTNKSALLTFANDLPFTMIHILKMTLDIWFQISECNIGENNNILKCKLFNNIWENWSLI